MTNKAWKDFISSFSHWRIFCLIGILDIKIRYARSKFGQFWITLSLAIQVCTMGVVWSYLFKIPAAEYIPYLATSLVLWNFSVASVTDGASAYITYTHYLKELTIPKLSYINAVMVKNMVILIHNIPILMIIYIYYSVPISLDILAASFYGFMILFVFLYLMIVSLSLLCLRFRDFPNIINSLIQVVMYLTPIMWKVETAPEEIRGYMVLNPANVFISLCRDPLLKGGADLSYDISAVIYLFIAFVLASISFSKFRSKIVYWL
ncbi:MAG: ABC transporter permease [Rickettsiaceae bacterium]|nr:ABC transporter permease [Rickettsiaceae bacterium]